MKPLPSCGLHYGVPFETYREWEAANISTIKPIKRSAAHCKWQMDHPKESDELNVGSALHMAILEPARFEKEFFIPEEEFDLRTKEGKDRQAAAEAAAGGRTILRRKKGEGVDADDVRGMAGAVWANQAAAKFLRMPGQCEVSAVWVDPITNVLCKARFDKLIHASRPIIFEIKTTRDATEWGFGKDCHTYGYAAQASYYRWAHEVLTGVAPLHLILAVENKGPWASALWTLDDSALNTGTLEWRHCLDKFSECRKANIWPGYPETVRTLSLPSWATKSDDYE